MALLWINAVGEGKQDQERRTKDIFENYTARSSPRNNFSFVCIDLQNKQRGEGREQWKTVSTVKEIHLLLHSQQIKRSESQAGRASPRGWKVGVMEEQMEASPKRILPFQISPEDPLWAPTELEIYASIYILYHSPFCYFNCYMDAWSPPGWQRQCLIFVCFLCFCYFILEHSWFTMLLIFFCTA